MPKYVSAAMIKQLIREVLSDNKLNKSKNFDENKVYKDEPIIATASRMNSYVPSKIIEMRKLADTLNMTDAQIFYRQAQFMYDYTDDCPYHGDLVRYFPTYHTLTDPQLRGYFTWRTKLRVGIIEPAPLSFAFLYIYEQLMLIGGMSPSEEYERLNELSASFSELFPQTLSYLEDWKRDFVIYYGLDRALLSDDPSEEWLITLLHFREHSEGEVFSAAAALSSYNIERSKFCEKYREDLEKAFYRVYCALSDYLEKNRKKDLFTRLFGVRIACVYTMFKSAVFYDVKKYVDRKYDVNEIHDFVCEKGIWYRKRYYGTITRNRELGDILKTVESFVREKLNFRPLKPAIETKSTLAVIKKEIDCYFEEKKRNEKPVITLNLSSLGEIRRSADQTRDKLIIEEEEPEIVIKQEPVAAVSEPAEENEFGLSTVEEAFLRALLYEKSYAEILRENATTALLLSDSINEKLFDNFGDTVIDFSGDTPELIEDYINELKERIHE